MALLPAGAQARGDGAGVGAGVGTGVAAAVGSGTGVAVAGSDVEHPAATIATGTMIRMSVSSLAFKGPTSVRRGLAATGISV